MSETDAPQKEGQEPTPATETKVETKEVKTFDEDYVKQLRQEAAKYRTEAQEAKGKLSEREEAEQSDLEKAQTKLSKAEQTAAEATGKLLRYEVANDKKVPADAVEFLQGDTRESLEASADKILALVKTEEKTPDFDGGARTPAPEPESPEEEHNKTILEALFGSAA